MTESSFDRLLGRMPEIAEAVNKFDNEEVQRSAFDALVGAFGLPDARPAPRIAMSPSEQATNLKVVESLEDEADIAATGTEGTSRASGPTRRRPRKALARSWDGARDLDLRPDGVQSFRDFAAEKQPGNNRQKCTVAVHWLSEVANLEPIGVGHVMACYREVNWREPADLANALQVTASTQRWLDTSDMKAIKLTASGRNLVRHDLPNKKK